jgi:hypothetical protein
VCVALDARKAGSLNEEEQEEGGDGGVGTRNPRMLGEEEDCHLLSTYRAPGFQHNTVPGECGVINPQARGEETTPERVSALLCGTQD